MSERKFLVVAFSNGDDFRIGDRRTVTRDELTALTATGALWVTLCRHCDRSELKCIFAPCPAVVEERRRAESEAVSV